MFREWIDLFKEKNLLEEVFADYRQMLEEGRLIYRQTYTAILANSDLKVLGTQVNQHLDEMQRLETAIRRRIVTHLVMSEGHEVGTCLVIFRNAHDAFRLGELCRTLEDIASLGISVEYPERYREDVRKIFTTLDKQFETLIRAVETSDSDAMGRVLAELESVSRQCWQVIESIMKEFDGEVMAAVETSMTVRLCNRISKHLISIARGVTANPQKLP